MPATCFNHNSTPAAGACIQCGMPYCSECIRQVGRDLSCLKCAPAVAARQGITAPPPQSQPAMLGQQPQYPQQSAYPQQQPYPQQKPYTPQGAIDQSGGYPQPSSTLPPNPNWQPRRSSAQEWQKKYDSQYTPLDLVKGLLLASAVGIIGSILVMKFVFYTGYTFAYAFVGIGFGIGWGMWVFNGKGDAKRVFICEAIYVASILIGHLVYAGDELAKLKASGSAPADATAFDAFIPVMQNMSLFEWAFVGLGAFACWKAESRRSD